MLKTKPIGALSMEEVEDALNPGVPRVHEAKPISALSMEEAGDALNPGVPRVQKVKPTSASSMEEVEDALNPGVTRVLKAKPTSAKRMEEAEGALNPVVPRVQQAKPTGAKRMEEDEGALNPDVPRVQKAKPTGAKRMEEAEDVHTVSPGQTPEVVTPLTTTTALPVSNGCSLRIPVQGLSMSTPRRFEFEMRFKLVSTASYTTSLCSLVTAIVPIVDELTIGNSLAARFWPSRPTSMPMRGTMYETKRFVTTISTCFILENGSLFDSIRTRLQSVQSI